MTAWTGKSDCEIKVQVWLINWNDIYVNKLIFKQKKLIEYY